MHFETATTIAAPPARVWSVLADLAAWPSWDSGVLRTEGTLEQGGKVKVEVEANPGRTFPLKVTELQAPAALTLTGGMPLGLFRGVRTYRLDAEGDGTRFTMREQYTGPLAGLITRSIPDLQPSFDEFAAGLKARAEAA